MRENKFNFNKLTSNYDPLKLKESLDQKREYKE